MSSIFLLCFFVFSCFSVSASDDYGALAEGRCVYQCKKCCAAKAPRTFASVEEDEPQPLPSIVERIPGVARLSYQVGTWWCDVPWDNKIVDLCKIYWVAYAVSVFLFF